MSLKSASIVLIIFFFVTIGILFWNASSDIPSQPTTNFTSEDLAIQTIPPSSFPISELKVDNEPAKSFFESVVSFFTPSPNNDFPQTSIPSESPSSEIPKTPIPPTQLITPTQPNVFSKIWPDYYRSFLSETQSAMLDQNFITPNQALSFDSEENIYSFLNSFTYFFKGVSEMSDLEFAELQIKLSRVSILKDQQKQEVLGALSFQKIIKPFINKAEASWITGGLCYKDNAPNDASMGFASPVYCCNCGIKITSHGSYFVSDCQVNGNLCTIQLGCLNGICKGKSNGLWDISTTMCGCG